MLRLLHLSDIHFRTPFCEDPKQDRDGPIRDALIKDIESIIQNDSRPISAILITGDIAFKAETKEFEFAAQWLDDLCRRFSCPPLNVYVVPGNHDVNRATAGKLMIDAVRQRIMNKQGEARESAFRMALLDSQAGAELIKPMNEYNVFAARYRCDITPQNPFWTDKLPIDEGVDLIINGLTSTFFSGEHDDIGRLFLGGIQTNFRTEDGCIHLSMMHHPCDWFVNSDDVIDDLNNGAGIQLFGHKHRGRWDPGMGTVRIAADSIHPDRAEGGYEPGYNILDLHLSHNHAEQPQVTVSAKIRVLQNAPRIFIGKQNYNQTEVFEYHIPVNPRPTAPISAQTPPAAPEEPSSTQAQSEQESTNEEFPQPSQVNGKEMAFRFWNLKLSQRSQILTELNLLEEEHMALPENERYRTAFKNANEMGVVDKLIEKVTTAEKINE
ncbi:metallophosphoesterase [Microbulbifer sp. PSTR4-B]|uniref:metallophosphoesterase n=1 Tax=Microbulbifer sp. PSTR4-B TaxID=3243396 RepID=UPI00403A0B12